MDDKICEVNNEPAQEEEQCNLQQLDDCKKIIVVDTQELIRYSIDKQDYYNQPCYAIAFNQDNTIMFASCGEYIKVFEFQNDKLKELQVLSEHSDRVYCLKFMKQSNQLVSGSQDKTMIIWKQNENQQWQCIQVMNEYANHIIINKNEDLLISGAYYKSIKFWSIQNNVWSCKQSIDCQSDVQSFCLNEQEDQLIASVYNDEILVIQLEGQEWIIKQNISVEKFGWRLCFINQNQFVFQPYDKSHLQIFDYDAKDQTYKKGQELQYSSNDIYEGALFPIQYISQIGLLLVKYGYHVHLIKRNQNGSFIVEQSIKFDSPHIYGCITDDGRYIATWDDGSHKIQIRKYEF